MKQNLVLQSSAGNLIRISYYSAANKNSENCIILVHGFKGFKDWGFFPYTAEYFAGMGINCVSFNFSHNGLGNDKETFTELDKFANNTYSLEADELNEVINSLTNNSFGFSFEKIGLIGHSRGGLASLISARQNKAVVGVVTWAGISNADRFSERQKKEWRIKGYFEVMNLRTNQLMRLNKIFLDDLEINLESRFNIENIVRGLNIPYLIIQGEQDLAVKKEEAANLHKWSDADNTRMVLIPATGHTFDITHPFVGCSDKFRLVLENTFNFFSDIFK